MTTLIQCTGISHRAGARELFADLDLTVSSKDRIGLVGYNGSGKTTLLELLSGRVEADGGDISRNQQLELAAVEQFIPDELLEYSLFEALANKLPREDASDREHEVAIQLERLGFRASEFEYRVSDLSGGQQNRLMFARAIISSPDLVLFDEPTNHLDWATLARFEHYFEHHLRAAFLLVSHDRRFLDNVTRRTLFLRDGRLYSFQLPYTEAKAMLDQRDAADLATRAAEEKQIERLEASAKRLATWGKVYDNEDLARKAKSMEKRIDKLEEDRTFVTRGSDLALSLDLGSTRAKRTLAIEDLTVNAPDGRPLFDIEAMTIRPRDRVALLGANGVGKTTLIRQIVAAHEDAESRSPIVLSPQCTLGYYDQELEQLDDALTLLDALRQRCPGNDQEHRQALIRAGFPYEDLGKQVGVLSGGEKARLMFLIIERNRPNFLILDEPTNHIDIKGREQLEAQLLSADAALLIASHDRHFVGAVANRFYLIADGALREAVDPNAFSPSTDDPTPEPTARKRAPREAALAEEDLLERLIELEDKLAADLARKAKHQKPRLQEEWRREIAELQSRFGSQGSE